ncbi:hypothetical protein GCM10023186_39660 [Hymenobacter koreensis]|uniref:IPT/TIG domain-containing protein n=1 Tax=Hymenobacter koreensis TaxID=1084523 RepID=A0ABP8JHE8_9BACT
MLFSLLLGLQSVTVAQTAAPKSVTLLNNNPNQVAIPDLTATSNRTIIGFDISTYSPNTTIGRLYVNGSEVTGPRQISTSEATQLQFAAGTGTGQVVFSYRATQRNPNGSTSTSAAVSYTITVEAPPAPTVASFSPTTGPAAGGNQITINGANFTSNSTVTIAGVAATAVTYVSATQLLATAPARPADTYGLISVTSPFGTGTNPQNYIYLGPPAISSISPTSGPIGQLVTISGSSLNNASLITFNGKIGSDDDVTAVPVSSNSTSVTVNVPAGVVVGTLSVTTPGGSATSTQTFTPPFVISKVTPAANALTAERNVAIRITFSQDVTSASAANIRVFSSQIGYLRSASISTNENVVTITPAPYFFKPGEVVSVTVPNTVVNASNQAVGNPQVYQFTVKTANGTGAFSGTMDKLTNDNPSNEVLGDVDGDGKLDLIVVNYGNGTGNTVSILRNTRTTGAADFANKQDFTLGAGQTGCYNIAIGDLDGDGKLDIATANYGTNNVSVLLNTSTSAGNISFAASQAYAVATGPSGLAIGDVDGDGRQDVVTSNQQSNNVSVLRNTSTSVGAIAFASPVNFATALTCYGVVLGDMNKDGKLDIITANAGSASVSVLRNATSGPGPISTSSFAAKQDFTVGSSPVVVNIGDLDGDGKLDIVTSNNGTNNVSVLRNTTTGTAAVSFATKLDFGVGVGPAGVSIGDLDSDGKLDIVAADYGDSGTSGGGTTVSILRSTSTGVENIGFATRTTVTVGIGPNNVLLGDLDGDGDLDIVTANQGGAGNTTSVRINATSAAPQPLPVELIFFSAQVNGASVRLDWATASEKANAGFVVERSVNGFTFAQMSTLAGQGTSSTRHNYSWLDEQLPTTATTLYYRLRQVDTDGTVSYSPVRTVTKAETTARFDVAPTVVADGLLRYSFAGTTSEASYLEVYALTGRHMGRHAVGAQASGAVQVKGLAAGWYIVRYVTPERSYTTRMFVR